MKRLFAIVTLTLILCATNAYAQDEFRFLGTNDSLWSDSGNWADGLKPDHQQATAHLLSSVVVDEDVEVLNLVYDAAEVSVTVSSGCKLTVGGLMTPFADQSLAQTLVVEDSAQLCYGHPVQATVRCKLSPFYNKDVAAWHFIASPLAGQLLPADLDSLVYDDANFELMRFNQSHVGGEWERYKDETFQSDFQLENGQGYLYANGSVVTVSFVGEVLPNDQPVSVGLVYDGATNVAAKGLNLVGNPFTCDAYADRSYYRMNADGTDVELVRASAREPIASCEGVMTQATAVGQSVSFSRTPVVGTDNGCLVLTLTSGGALADQAMLSFNEGDAIGKFNFTRHTAYLYFQQDGLNRAIGTAATSCQMPLHFTTTENGSFVLTVTPDNADIRSLYLVDNLTGADINLLASPSYAFSATTADYPSRFKLFVNTDHGVGEETETPSFAYYADGSIILQGIEGEAALDLFDVTGRLVQSQRIDGASGRMAVAIKGVYLLRLTSGSTVRTQKVVVW